MTRLFSLAFTLCLLTAAGLTLTAGLILEPESLVPERNGVPERGRGFTETPAWNR